MINRREFCKRLFATVAALSIPAHLINDEFIPKNYIQIGKVDSFTLTLEDGKEIHLGSGKIYMRK